MRDSGEAVQEQPGQLLAVTPGRRSFLGQLAEWLAQQPRTLFALQINVVLRRNFHEPVLPSYCVA